jgi:hypothetical protein
MLLRRGSRGPEVLQLQQALNREVLGGERLDEDGIFGAKTRAAVIRLQRQAGISADGIVGPETRGALGIARPGTPFTHRVRLHFRSLSNTNVTFSNILASAQRVYAPYGIKIEYRSGESMMLSAAEARRFEQVDGTCRWAITDGEYAELQQMGGHVPSTDILVFYINRFSSGNNGCGGHMRGRPACIVASSGTRWTTAHEVGHVLLTAAYTGSVHSGDVNNLMYRSTNGITASLPILTPAQVTQMKSSPRCVRFT